MQSKFSFFGQGRIVFAIAATAMGLGDSAQGAVTFASYTFTGPSALNPPTVQTTAEAQGVTLTAPTLVYPELTPGTSFDFSDGFGVAGRFDFLNGSGTSAELRFTATRPLSIVGNGVFTTALESGYFGINSADIMTGIGTGTVPVAATLTSFSTTSSLETTGGTLVAGTSSTAADTIKIIPLTATDFPNNAYHSVAGAITSQTNFISTGNYLLAQSVDIQFSNLLPGESVDIDLPTFTTINGNTVPEPGSFSLLVIGACTALSRRRRR